jgi:DnaK suppressor protein
MATKKSPAKAKAKTAPKKKVASKTKAAVKTKAPVKKKAAPKTKVAAKKKAAPKAKAAPKTKAAAKKKAAPKVKAAPKAKTTAKTKAKAKAKAPVKKKAAPKAKAAPQSTNNQAQSMQSKEFTPYNVKRGEEYMNDLQKEHFRNILFGWRNKLMEEVDRTVHHMQDEAANPPDPADRATLEEEFSIELRTRDRERRLIKKIDSTIEMIANDEYGWCDSCGVEIGIRRLEARPTANKCIDCKTLDEIKERQLGA